MKWHYKLGICVLILGLLLLVILLPLAFQYVARNSWAFKKKDITNSVDTSKVYGPGRYSWGVGHSAVLFPSVFQFVELAEGSSLTVFIEGLSMSIDISFQYRLKKEHLKDIFDRYGLDYSAQIPNNARTALRGAAAEMKIQDFITNRKFVVGVLHTALEAELSKVWVEVPLTKFQLRRVVLPADLTDQRITTFVQLELQDTETRKQQAISVRKENERLQTEIASNTTILRTRAAAVEDRLVEQEVAASKRRLEQTQAGQVEKMFSRLNVTSSKAKKQFLHYMTLLDANSPRMMIGVGSNVIVNTQASNGGGGSTSQQSTAVL